MLKFLISENLTRPRNSKSCFHAISLTEIFYRKTLQQPRLIDRVPAALISRSRLGQTRRFSHPDLSAFYICQRIGRMTFGNIALNASRQSDSSYACAASSYMTISVNTIILSTLIFSSIRC